MPKAFPPARARIVFHDFQRSLSHGDLALFLSNVRQVDLGIWDEGRADFEKVASMKVNSISTQESSIQAVRTFLECFSNVSELHEALVEEFRESSEASMGSVMCCRAYRLQCCVRWHHVFLAR